MREKIPLPPPPLFQRVGEGRGLLLPGPAGISLHEIPFGQGSGGLRPQYPEEQEAGSCFPNIGPPVIHSQLGFMNSRFQRGLIHSSSDWMEGKLPSPPLQGGGDFPFHPAPPRHGTPLWLPLLINPNREWLPPSSQPKSAYRRPCKQGLGWRIEGAEGEVS